MMRAAPTACTARAEMRVEADVEKPAKTLPATNTPRPARKARLRPHESAILPVDSNNAASSTAYRLFTHCAWVRSRPRSVIIDGNATPTIVPSRTMTPSPTERTARLIQSRRVGVVTSTSLITNALLIPAQQTSASDQAPP